MKDKYRVRDFARWTGATVRALHYYDQIGLLRPSERSRSGYRLYTARDLLRLQQIVTLKFMGFSLKEIKRILSSPRFSVKNSLALQAQAVEEKIASLKQAVRAMRQTLTLLDAERTADWKKIISIMEAIQLSEDAKKTWHKKFFTAREMAQFEELGKKYTPEAMQAYQDQWAALIAEVEKNLEADPSGPVAQDLGRRWQALFNEAYGNAPQLKERIGQAYASDKVPQGLGPSPRAFEFIRKATQARPKK